LLGVAASVGPTWFFGGDFSYVVSVGFGVFRKAITFWELEFLVLDC